MTGPNLREAVRAVIVDHAERVLLVHFGFSHRSLWATPGGGIEPGEDHEPALGREMAEELGLADPTVGPEIWIRTHVFDTGAGHDGQREHFYLIRTDGLEPRPLLTRAELAAEHVIDVRWWPRADLEQSDAVFAPRSLPRLIGSLLDDGPPLEPFDVGV